MTNLTKSERWSHLCENCRYHGSTYAWKPEDSHTTLNTAIQNDWYTCQIGHDSITKRYGNEPNEHVSTNLVGESIEFDFVREALKLDILKLAIN
jgi:hypothetical protein